METILKLIHVLGPRSQAQIDEACLAESVNLHDLEQQLLELDRRAPDAVITPLMVWRSYPH